MVGAGEFSKTALVPRVRVLPCAWDARIHGSDAMCAEWPYAHVYVHHRVCLHVVQHIGVLQAISAMYG